jgi:hypothetical protein
MTLAKKNSDPVAARLQVILCHPGKLVNAGQIIDREGGAPAIDDPFGRAQAAGG